MYSATNWKAVAVCVKNMNHREANEGVQVQVFPPHLSYGCVSQGYVYNLTVTVVNKGSKPQSLKVHVRREESEQNRLRSNFVPIKIAPGTKQVFTCDLIAEYAGASKFQLIIEQGINNMSTSKTVQAMVVPLDVFRHVAKSLTLQKRPIYRNGVMVLGAIGAMDDSRSLVTGGSTVLSEAIMDDADMEDLIDLPLFNGVYYDHANQCLGVDQKLCEVVVSGDFTLEDSIEKTGAARGERLDELEDKGWHTTRGQELMAMNHTRSGATSPFLGGGASSPHSLDLDGGSLTLGAMDSVNLSGMMDTTTK